MYLFVDVIFRFIWLGIVYCYFVFLDDPLDELNSLIREIIFLIAAKKYVWTEFLEEISFDIFTDHLYSS